MSRDFTQVHDIQQLVLTKNYGECTLQLTAVADCGGTVSGSDMTVQLDLPPPYVYTLFPDAANGHDRCW
ncbi:MAG: hypothetical protein WA220_08220 [Candidatus Nitrosopolaris sp.]